MLSEDKFDSILRRLIKPFCMGLVAPVLLVLYLFPDVVPIFQFFSLNVVPVAAFVGLVVATAGSLLLHPAGKAITTLYEAAMLTVAVLVSSLVPLARILFVTKLMIIFPLLAGVMLLLVAPFHKPSGDDPLPSNLHKEKL